MESNGRSGHHYVTQLSGYKAFIPHSLPPKPDIVIDGEIWNLWSIDLVSNLRSSVRDWREAFYIGASDTTIQLLTHWFGRAHRQTTPNGEDLEFRYYFCQRETIAISRHLSTS
jgi:hypothetical protein